MELCPHSDQVRGTHNRPLPGVKETSDLGSNGGHQLAS